MDSLARWRGGDQKTQLTQNIAEKSVQMEAQAQAPAAPVVINGVGGGGGGNQIAHIPPSAGSAMNAGNHDHLMSFMFGAYGYPVHLGC